jgi:hypothetical protein
MPGQRLGAKMRNTQPEQFRSADHPRADLKAEAGHFGSGPEADVFR